MNWNPVNAIITLVVVVVAVVLCVYVVQTLL